MSIVLMVNEKAREGVSPWTCFHDNEKKFGQLWNRILSLRDGKLSLVERNFFLIFLIGAFHSLEDPLVRPLSLRLVSLPCWHALSETKLAALLKAPKIEKNWRHLLRLEKKGGESMLLAVSF
jgi:intron-binding protein aquarius